MKRILVSRLVSASVIVAVIGALTVAAVALPGPLTDDNPSDIGEVSGNCDEAEHANDPECGGVGDTPPAPGTQPPASDDPTTPVDISGNCDEAEHFGDPGCNGSGGNAGTTTGTQTSAAAASGGVVAAGEAGTVTYSFDGATFTVDGADANDGWTAVVERQSGLEIEVKFLKGTVRIDVQMEIEHGAVRERVRTRDRADDSETRVENGTVTRTEAGSDDSGSDDSGSDDSGSGHGSDDSGSDDSGSDNSGSGKSGSGSDS